MAWFQQLSQRAC